MSSEIRKVTLAEPGDPSPTPPWLGLASWLVGPLFLAALIGGLVLLRREPEGVFTAILVLVCGAPVLWGLVSLFFPASPDRLCPECGEFGLEATSHQKLQGVHCSECGYSDQQQSSWKFAEERDAPLEPLVIASRRAPSHFPQREDPSS